MKTKVILTIILAIMLGFGAIAQQYVILVQPAGVKEWGYADLSGNLIIEAKYKKCIGFSEDGLAAIYDGKLKQFYFINIKGETLPVDVKEFKLKEVFLFGMKGFNDGFAPVEVKEKWGFLNTQGKLAIPAVYDKVTVFNDGFAACQKGDKFYAVDGNAVEYLVDVPGIVDLNDFNEQLASFKTEGGQVGFVDGTGKVVIPAKFESVGDFRGGVAWAKVTGGLVGFIDTKGAWLLEPKFEAAKNYDPETGLARVKTAETWAYINFSGNVLSIKDAEGYDDFSCGLAKGKRGGKFGFFDSKGEWVILPQFDGARDFKNGYASVRKGELWGIIDKSGKWVVEPKFEDIKDVEVVK